MAHKAEDVYYLVLIEKIFVNSLFRGKDCLKGVDDWSHKDK